MYGTPAAIFSDPPPLNEVAFCSSGLELYRIADHQRDRLTTPFKPIPPVTMPEIAALVQALEIARQTWNLSEIGLVSPYARLEAAARIYAAEVSREVDCGRGAALRFPVTASSLYYFSGRRRPIPSQEVERETCALVLKQMELATLLRFVTAQCNEFERLSCGLKRCFWKSVCAAFAPKRRREEKLTLINDLTVVGGQIGMAYSELFERSESVRKLAASHGLNGERYRYFEPYGDADAIRAFYEKAVEPTIRQDAV